MGGYRDGERVYGDVFGNISGRHDGWVGGVVEEADHRDVDVFQQFSGAGRSATARDPLVALLSARLMGVLLSEVVGGGLMWID